MSDNLLVVFVQSIQKISVTEQVVNSMKKEILSGAYAVGDKLPPEKELSGTLGVGRSTVREALRVLQAMNLVEILQGRGAFVKRTREESSEGLRAWFAANRVELLDFMDVRLSIELLAVRLAVERAEASEIDRIEEVLELFKEALSKQDVFELAAADEAFHSAIAAASHNDLLVMISEELANAFKTYRLKSFAVKENAKNALGPHTEILEALRAREAEDAVAAMERHIHISIRDIQEVVRNGSQQGGRE